MKNKQEFSEKVAHYGVMAILIVLLIIIISRH